MKNCLLVVIISRIWDVVFILCFCGASDGSTLLTMAFSCINGVTKVTQHHLHRYGHPIFFGCAVCFNPWYVDFISGSSSCDCENQLWFSWLTVELLSPFRWRLVSLKPFVCGLQYSAGLLCFMAKPLAFVILCGLCSWKNIHGEHGWHRILKYNYALPLQTSFILQSLKYISRMSWGFS